MHNTIFPFRFFNLIPIEDPLWSFQWSLLVVIAYEATFSTRNKTLLANNSKYWFLILAIGFGIFFAFNLFARTILSNIPYVYLIFGIIFALVPLILFLIFYPRYFVTFLKAGAYLSAVSFANEIVSLKLGHWLFPGKEFLGFVSFFGQTFPVEELFFFILIGPIFTLCYYQFFDGD